MKLVAAAVIFPALAVGVLHAHRPAAPRGDRAAVRLLANLARHPRSAHGLTRGRWRLLRGGTGDQVCLLLIVPRTTRQGTCTSREGLRRRALLVFTGQRPSRGDPARPDRFVVYGFVSSAVRSLRVVLSDCSTIEVRLEGRPVFWSFVPPRSLANGIVASGYAARLNRGGRVLATLGPDPLPHCRFTP
jgi:hypothetical protein